MLNPLDLINNPNPDVFLSDNYLVIDFETTNVDKGNPYNEENRLLLSCWEWPDGRTGAQWGGIFEQEELLSHLSRADYFVCHGGKFECGWLARCGVPIHSILCFDTLISEYTIRSTRTYSLSLDECFRRTFGEFGKDQFVSSLIKNGVCPSEIPKGALLNYCGRDVESTHKLFRESRRNIYNLGLEKVNLTRQLLVPCIADIESRGMKLDPKEVQRVHREVADEKRRVDGELLELTGGANPRSTKQMREFIFGALGFDKPTDFRGNPITTDTGELSVSKEVIANLKAHNQLQRRFIDLKTRQSKLDGQLSKYLNKFLQCCELDNGVISASINQTVTKTGRFSSTGRKYKTQYQNIDRGFKPLFTCRYPDWLIGELDERQLEFRVAVWFGNDETGRASIAADEDVHQFTADMLGVSRQDAKSHTFKPLYGGSSGTKKQKEYYKAFKNKYKGIAKWQKEQIEQALRTKKTVMPTGLILYWDSVRIDKTGYVIGSTDVVNYPVQYLATGEVLPISLLILWHSLATHSLESFIVNTVHDSIIAEVIPKERELFSELAVKAMTTENVVYMKKLYDIDFDVPLEVETKFNTHWGKKE